MTVTRTEYDAATARLQLLGGTTPPQTITVPASPADGIHVPHETSNPAFSVWREAVASREQDLAVVAEYEAATADA